MTDDRVTILYGLAACDTCRKARRALESAGRTVVFRDLRDVPLSAEERGRFLSVFGGRLINRASATWRALSDAARSEPPDALLAAYPAVMKRPLIETRGQLWLGWDVTVQNAVLK